VLRERDPTPGFVHRLHFYLYMQVIVGGFDAHLIQSLRLTEIHIQVHSWPRSSPCAPARGGGVIEGELTIPRIGPGSKPPFRTAGKLTASMKEAQFVDAPLLQRRVSIT